MAETRTGKEAIDEEDSEGEAQRNQETQIVRRILMPHQRRGIQHLRNTASAPYQGILAAAPGTGKTLMAIRAAWGFNPTRLVICRRDDFLTWKLELEMEGYIPETQLHFIDSKDAIPWNIVDGSHNPEYVFVTYDLLRNKDVYEFIKDVNWSCVIADEVHAIKRWKAARTKATIKATRHVQRRIGLTGTPLTNDPMDVFSLCLFADDGRAFGDSQWRFIHNYFLTIPGQHGQYLRKDAKPKIVKKLKEIMFHVHEDDVLQLPSMRRVVKSVAMSTQQQQAYERVLYEWELAIEGQGQGHGGNAESSVLEINYVIVQLQKLKQIASGFYYDQFHEAHRLECSKLNLLLEMVDDPEYLGNKNKIVIWCSYTDEINRIVEALWGQPGNKHTMSCRRLCGEMNPNERETSRLDFRDRKDVRYFVAQVDAGMGMNELVISDTAVYFSNSFKVVSKQQSMRRTRRKGSEIHMATGITYWELVSEKTVDVRTLSTVQKKMSFAQDILNQLKRGKPLRSLVT